MIGKIKNTYLHIRGEFVVFDILYPSKYWIIIGAIMMVFFSFANLSYFKNKLPTDGGRAFAVDGKSAKGKPTSAGIIFIPIMIINVLLFTRVTWKFALIFPWVFLASLFGYLDDRKPWKALTKGLTDIIISLGSGVLAAYLFPRHIVILALEIEFTVPLPLYILLAGILVWCSINFTNASDGVDGLCGSLSMISIFAFLLMSNFLGQTLMLPTMIYTFLVLGVYLWFNCNPSELLMGDSGSQAFGVLLAFFAMASGNPFSYIIICLPMILDGGSSLFKLAICRITKKQFMKNIRTPLHDHCRKNWGWVNQKVTERFMLIHVLIIGIYVAILAL